MKKIGFGVLAMLLAPWQCAHEDTARTAVRMVIDTRWRGLGDPLDEHFELTATRDGYRIDGHLVDAAGVQTLVSALTAMPMERDAALRELASTEWLRENAGPSYRVLSEAQGECSPAASTLFTNAFTDPRAAIRAFRSHYDNRHTDDFPSMHLEVRLADGSHVRARTHSQHALMLPWTTDRGETWNPAISRALAAILPATSKLRSRLLDGHLARQLAWEIGEQISERWEDLEERCLYAAIVRKLEGRVTLERVYHAWPGQFAAHLRVPGAPSNLLIDVHLTADRPDAVETFLERIPHYVETARKFVAANPDTTFELWYKDGASVTEDSLQLHGILHPDDPNLKRVETSSSDAALLRDHGDPFAQRKWVVLPTGEVVDWGG